jgi:hypothetical protein
LPLFASSGAQQPRRRSDARVQGDGVLGTDVKDVLIRLVAERAVRFPVDNSIKSRHTANGIVKYAGLDKAF